MACTFGVRGHLILPQEQTIVGGTMQYVFPSSTFLKTVSRIPNLIYGNKQYKKLIKIKNKKLREANHVFHRVWQWLWLPTISNATRTKWGRFAHLCLFVLNKSQPKRYSFYLGDYIFHVIYFNCQILAFFYFLFFLHKDLACAYPNFIILWLWPHLPYIIKKKKKIYGGG